MCGICGKLLFDGSVVDAGLVAKMARTMEHRGPDDEGIYTAPYIGLGQRRLSIIDLRREAAAPLSNEDGTIWVVHNGEIYNFAELRADLEKKGHLFRTGTDTEVIVHLYEERGIDCIEKMRGMFAFALWDGREKRFFAARDRFGKKPLCYATTGRSLIFGSEIKAITADPEISVSPDYTAIDRYLSYQYVPSPLTAFEGISKLPPAHFLTWDSDGSVRVERYWSPPSPPKTASRREEIEEEIVSQLREAVSIRLVSDVPLGALLSGGLDSAAVVALMSEQSSKPVKTFSIGFDDEEHNELPYARLVAKRYGTDHHEMVVKPDAAEVLPLLARHYNEPFADSSAVPTYYVSKMTKESVTVALSGDGGDESFAGYKSYEAVEAWAALNPIPHAARRVAAKAMISALDMMPYQNSIARLSRGLHMAGSNLDDRFVLNMQMLKPEEKRALYSPKLKAMLEDQPLVEDRVAAFPWDKGMDDLDWMMRHDLSFYLPDCLMVKTDIASMANGLELRCPMLDHEFVQMASSIPSRMKRSGKESKIIFKSAFSRLLPEKILTKRKTGFAVPLKRWLSNDLAPLLKESLLGPTAQKRGLFRKEFVEKMIREQERGIRDWSNRLWGLLFLETWFREMID